MSARKVSPQNGTDKQIIESLIRRLNDLIKQPANAKKSALIIEAWLAQKPKK